MREIRNAYIFIKKPNRKRPCRRPRHGWEDNIRIDLREIGWEVVDWIHLVQDRDQWCVLMNMAVNLWVPKR
jgi:hypothetical protein